jgi:transposase-like protein
MSTNKRTRSKYPKEKLQEAARAVIEGSMTSVTAAETYGIPQSTIRSHVNHPTKRIGAGRSSYLDQEKERHLVELIKSLEQIGVRLTKPILRKVVNEYLRLTTDDPRFKSRMPNMHLIVFVCSFH